MPSNPSYEALKLVSTTSAKALQTFSHLKSHGVTPLQSIDRPRGVTQEVTKNSVSHAQCVSFSRA